MRVFPLFALLLIACQADTGLSHDDGGGDAIEGDAKMELSSTEIAWEDLIPGQTYSHELTISSTGERNLQIYSGRITESTEIEETRVFYAEDEWKTQKTIMAGTSVTMLLTAYFEDTDETPTTASGTLEIKCNDVDETIHLIPLSASLVSEDTGGGGDTGGDNDTGQGGDTGTAS